MSEEQPEKKGEPGSEIMELSSTDSETESPKEDPEDDIQFVSEGPLRPVLEYIDLVSSDDEEPSTSHINEKVKSKDYVEQEKDRVALTLARLARHVEVDKQQKEEKNKAFRTLTSIMGHILSRMYQTTKTKIKWTMKQQWNIKNFNLSM